MDTERSGFCVDFCRTELLCCDRPMWNTPSTALSFCVHYSFFCISTYCISHHQEHWGVTDNIAWSCQGCMDVSMFSNSSLKLCVIWAPRELGFGFHLKCLQWILAAVIAHGNSHGYASTEKGELQVNVSLLVEKYSSLRKQIDIHLTCLCCRYQNFNFLSLQNMCFWRHVMILFNSVCLRATCEGGFVCAGFSCNYLI